MALVSYDSILAALDAGNGQLSYFGKNSITTSAGAAYSLWQATGSPGQGSVAGVALTSTSASKATTGAMPFVNASPDQLRLVSMSAMSTVANVGQLILIDRLLYYPGITVGSVAPIALAVGASIPRYTTGEGTVMFLETAAAITQSAGTFSTSYTNQDGTAGRTSETATYLSNSPVNRINHVHGPFIGLQNPDTGVRSVESITFTATTSAGSFALVIARPIATLPLFSANAAVERDLVLNTPRFPNIEDDACLQWIVWCGTTSTGALQGELAFVSG